MRGRFLIIKRLQDSLRCLDEIYRLYPNRALQSLSAAFRFLFVTQLSFLSHNCHIRLVKRAWKRLVFAFARRLLRKGHRYSRNRRTFGKFRSAPSGFFFRRSKFSDICLKASSSPALTRTNNSFVSSSTEPVHSWSFSLGSTWRFITPNSSVRITCSSMAMISSLVTYWRDVRVRLPVSFFVTQL
jgi:hypothetical protein